MESLNLNNLASSLPISTAQQNAEKELLNDFKAAALSITTLYRSSRKSAKKAYNAGYAAACQDMLNFIQQGVCVSGSASDSGVSSLASGSAGFDASLSLEGSGVTIGRIMDWIEARLEAIKAREEEEDEDEEKEKEKDKDSRGTNPQRSAPAVVSNTSTLKVDQKSRKESSLPTSHSPELRADEPSMPSSPSPPPPTSLPNRSGVSSSTSRPSRTRPPPSKDSFRPHNNTYHLSSSSPSSPATFLSDPTTASSPATPINPDASNSIMIGNKRRHAVMRMLDSVSVSPASITIAPSGQSFIGSNAASPTLSSPGGGGVSVLGGGAGSGGSIGHGHGQGFGKQRRSRSSRNLNGQLQPHNTNISVVQMQMDPDDMDIEDDGRERKRVARR